MATRIPTRCSRAKKSSSTSTEQQELLKRARKLAGDAHRLCRVSDAPEAVATRFLAVALRRMLLLLDQANAEGRDLQLAPPPKGPGGYGYSTVRLELVATENDAPVRAQGPARRDGGPMAQVIPIAPYLRGAKRAERL